MRGGWKIEPLRELAEIGAGNSAPQKKELFEGGTYPFIRTSDVGKIHLGSIETAADKLNGRGIRGLKLFPPGTVLFPKSGASTFLNHRVILGRESYVSSHLATIKAHTTKILDRYLLHFLATVDARELVQAHDYPSLNRTVLQSILVSYPASLAEQERIVAILDAAFEGIDTAVANAEQNLVNARGLFDSFRERQLCPGQIGWIERRLDELVEVKHGFAFKSEWFTDEPNEYVVLTPGNFHESGGYRYRGSKQKFYIGEIPSEFVLRPGDLLVAMTEQAAGLLGSSLIVPAEPTFLHNQRLGLIQPREGVPWLNGFFTHVFNLRAFRKSVHDSASGVKVRHTSPKKMGRVSVAFPASVKEQEHVAGTLDEAGSRTAELEANLDQKKKLLGELRQSILHKAVTGAITAAPEAALREAVVMAAE